VSFGVSILLVTASTFLQIQWS